MPFGTPAGITVTCLNGAQAFGTGCEGTLTLDQNVTTSGSFSETQNAFVDVTNNTGALYTGVNTFGDEVPDGILFDTQYAGAFPGSNLGIDNAATESASFTSSVGGAGVDSAYACSIPGTGGFTSADRACPDGIGSADVSEGIANAAGLQGLFSEGIEPGTTVGIPYVSMITADFSLPEPPMWPILFMGLMGVLLARPGRDGPSATPR